jgi:hypothetical protein
MATATYDLIASQTLASAAASITFSSIAATYTDLRLVLVTKTSSASSVSLRFNSDTASNYSSTYLLGNGSAASSGKYTNNTTVELADNTGTGWCMQTADIFSYAGSTYKTVLASNNDDENGSGTVDRSVSLWRSTSAINTVFIGTLSAVTMAVGTVATLYGIKAA